MAGWLLTPLVVWAASFLGGWLGALIGRTVGGFLGGGIWLLVGSLTGGTVGLIGWLRVMSLRRLLPSHAGSTDASQDESGSVSRRSDETA